MEKENSIRELVEFQEECEKDKRMLLGNLSALFREKVAKLREFGENYTIEEDQDQEELIEHKGISTQQEEQ
jgi:hypothetical protein